jgi:hypothetical protein
MPDVLLLSFIASFRYGVNFMYKDLGQRIVYQAEVLKILTTNQNVSKELADIKSGGSKNDANSPKKSEDIEIKQLFSKLIQSHSHSNKDRATVNNLYESDKINDENIIAPEQTMGQRFFIQKLVSGTQADFGEDLIPGSSSRPIDPSPGCFVDKVASGRRLRTIHSTEAASDINPKLNRNKVKPLSLCSQVLINPSSPANSFLCRSNLGSVKRDLKTRLHIAPSIPSQKVIPPKQQDSSYSRGLGEASSTSQMWSASHALLSQPLWSVYLYSYFPCCLKKDRRNQLDTLAECVSAHVTRHLDAVTIIRAIDEIHKIKEFLFSPDQLVLFDLLPRTKLHYSEEEKRFTMTVGETSSEASTNAMQEELEGMRASIKQSIHNIASKAERTDIDNKLIGLLKFLVDENPEDGIG